MRVGTAGTLKVILPGFSAGGVPVLIGSLWTDVCAGGYGFGSTSVSVVRRNDTLEGGVYMCGAENSSSQLVDLVISVISEICLTRRLLI